MTARSWAVSGKKQAAESLRPCDHDSCTQPGSHPAPRERVVPDSFGFVLRTGYRREESVPASRYWFCLEHVRLYNAQWDFFVGMNTAEIDDFRRDALTGHRSVQDKHAAAREQKLYDEAMRYYTGEEAPPPTSEIPTDELTALKILGLHYPITLERLKAQYRSLAKRYHPDRAGKQAEALFKQITASYALLKRNMDTR